MKKHNLGHNNSYRSINYGDKWYAEKVKSTGIWEIIGTYSTKEDADKRILEYIKEVKAHGNN